MPGLPLQGVPLPARYSHALALTLTHVPYTQELAHTNAHMLPLVDRVTRACSG